MKMIAALIGALLIYGLQKILYRRFWNKNLTIDLHLSDHKAVEGDWLYLIEAITNRKLLPLPVLKLKYITSRNLLFPDTRLTETTDHTYRSDLFSLMMYQKLTRSIPFQCTKRGYYTIDKIILVCNDILLQSELVSEADCKLHLYVYPKTIEFSQLPIPFQSLLGTVLTKRLLFEDPFEFKSIRPYQSYDTMKTINWKASAKTGSLMVNVHNHTASMHIKILLNLEGDTLRKSEELEEEAIRLTATLATHFIEQKVPTSLYTNALDVISKEAVKTSAGSGPNHIRTINEALARIDTSETPPSFVSSLSSELEASDLNEYLVLISSYQRKDLQDRLSLLARKKIDFIWIIPVNNETSLTVENELFHHVITWEL